MLSTAKPALLVLADGTHYKGKSFGAGGTAIGEVVFNTGMTGYQEVLTDPSYCSQIVTFTCPELGNTGVNPEDEESDRPQIKAVIARNIPRRPSNWRSTGSLPDYLVEYGIPAIYGIDTRALTRKIRSVGAMNGGISTEILDTSELLAQVKRAPNMAGLNLVEKVTTREVYEWSEPTDTHWEFPSVSNKSNDDEVLTVVAIDFGIKRNILKRLASYGCRVIVVPGNATPAEVLQYNPHGIFLSNGPGDPAAVTSGVETVKALLKEKKPIFGICMGHQILSLSLGATTFKLKFGHRGLNQPAGTPPFSSPPSKGGSSALEQRVEITSQNHGFAVNADSLSHNIMVTYINLNDYTLAGICHKKLPFFSVQYHPEASPGPHDADYLFPQFVSLMREMV